MCISVESNVVFLQQQNSYRHPFPIGFAAVFAVLDLFIVAHLIFDLPNFKYSPDLWPGLIVGPVWLIATGGMAIWLMMRILFFPVVESRIDSMGIEVDGKRFPWEQVDSIFGRRASRQGVSVHFQLRGGWLAMVRHIPMRPVSEVQFDELLDQLESFLSQSHPDVIIGE